MVTRQALPPGPKGLPWIGSRLSIARNPLGFISDLARNYGPISAAEFGPGALVSVNEPDLIEELFLTRHRDCMKDETTRQLVPLLGRGLLTSEGEQWRRQRKLAAPALQPKRLDGYAATMLRCAQLTAATLRDDEVRDFHETSMGLTLEIVGKTLLGFDTQRDAECVGAAIHDVVRYFERRLFGVWGLLPPSWPSPGSQRYRIAISTLDRIVLRMIERARHTAGDADHLLARLLRARGDAGETVSDVQARDEAMTMLLAGHETTALALTYAVYALSREPACEARLRDELAAIGDRPLALADLPRLPYLDAVIRETLRLYPPAWVFGRQVISSFHLAGYALPVGTEIICSPYALHRDPRFYAEPERFMPERWLDPGRLALPRYAYLPFGAGPRVCIGSHFALMEIALVLGSILQQVKLQVVPGYRLRLAPVITLRPRGGLPVLVRRLRPPPQPRQAPRQSHLRDEVRV